MSDSKSRLIQAAVRPFRDIAEMEMAAARFLADIVKSDEPSAEEAIARLDELDASKSGIWRRYWIYAVLTVISAVILTDGAMTLGRFENMISTLSGSNYVDFFHNSPRITEEEFSRTLTESGKRLLFGNRPGASKADQMKALWESDPENPAFFAEYSNAFLSENDKLPPDFLQTAKRIDPQNSWYTYVAAGVRAKNAVKRRERTKAARDANEPFEWDILDQAAMDEALALLKEGRSQPVYHDPRIPLRRDQMNLMTMRTPPEVTFALVYGFGTPGASDYCLWELGKVIAARAWLTGEANDASGFGELRDLSDAYLEKQLSAEVNTVHSELINRYISHKVVSNLTDAANKLGLGSDAMDATLERVNQSNSHLRGRRPRPNRDLVYNHGGNIESLIISATVSDSLMASPLLTPRDLEPGRLMDHETVSWTGCYFAWAVIMVAMAACASYRFRSPAMIRRLADRFVELIRPSDWIIVFGIGTLVPILWFVAVNRLSPLGGRGFSMVRNDLDVPYFDSLPLGLAQFISLAILLIQFPGLIACWRIGRRLRFIGSENPVSAFIGILCAAIAVLCAAAFIPLSGWSVVHSSETAAIASWILAAISVGWLVMFCTLALFTQGRNIIRYSILARVMVPVCAVGATAVISAAPFFKAEAYRWSAKDSLLKPSRDYPPDSDFEHRIAIQMRKELRETLGYRQ